VNRPLSLVFFVVVVACQSDPEAPEARTFTEDAVSLVPPAGWEIRRDRETLVLLGGSPTSRSRPTIAVRAVPITDTTEGHTADTVLPSTEKVLRALPGARVRGPFDVEHPVYQARAFDVTWTPRSRKGQRYQRRHVTLIAPGHLYHVFLTAAEGELENSRAELDRVIASLREDG